MSNVAMTSKRSSPPLAVWCHVILLALLPRLAEGAPRPSESVEAAVQTAAADPGSFTPTLDTLLKQLPTDELLNGLEYQHRRPAVTRRIRRVLGLELWRRMTSAPTNDLLRWFLLLAPNDPDTWLHGQILELIQLRPDGPWLIESVLRTRNDDGAAWLAATVARDSSASEVLRWLAHEAVWNTYLDRRTDQPPPTTRREQQETLLYWLNMVIGDGSRANFDRLRGLITVSIESRGYPLHSDLSLFQCFSPYFPEVGAELVKWSLSANDPLWRMASLHLAQLVRDGALVRGIGDYQSNPQLRQAFVRALRDPAFPEREMLAYALQATSGSTSPVERPVLLSLAEREPPSTARTWIWQAVAAFAPESVSARRFLFRKATSRDPRTSADALAVLARANQNVCWAFLPIARWVLEEERSAMLGRSRADQLTVLGHFFAAATDEHFGFGYRSEGARCGVGMEDEYRRRKDELAFGLRRAIADDSTIDQDWEHRQSLARRSLRQWIHRYAHDVRKFRRTHERTGVLATAPFHHWCDTLDERPW